MSVSIQYLKGFVWFLCFTVMSSSAYARDIGLFLFIDNCDDLERLLVEGELDEEDFEWLMSLCERPMSLNRVSREILAELPGMTELLAEAVVSSRTKAGAFSSFEELLDVYGMTSTIVDQIRPFLTLDDEAFADLQQGRRVQNKTRVSYGQGWRSKSSASSLEYGPSFLMDSRLDWGETERAQLALAVRKTAAAEWDRSLNALVSEGLSNSVGIEQMFVSGRWSGFRWVVGHYEIGFGERLTFDTTGKSRPTGWEFPKGRVPRDDGRFYFREPLLGASISWPFLTLPTGWLDWDVFVSYRPRRIYQYSMEYRDLNGEWSTEVLDPESLSTRSYLSLQHAFEEATGGLNFKWNLDRSTYLGVVGWGGQSHFTLGPGIDARFRKTYTLPQRGLYGAAGLYGGWTGLEHVVAGEASVTDQGALAAVSRWEWLPMSQYEQSISVRLYSTGFDNPYARSLSAPTLTEGKRTRNELGLRWSSRYAPSREMDLASRVDLYRPQGIRTTFESGEVRFIDGGRWSLEWSERLSYKVTKRELISLEWRFKDKELGVGGRNQAYYDDIDDWADITAEGLGIDPSVYDELAAEGVESFDSSGAGMRMSSGLRLSSRRLKWLTGSFYWRYEWRDVSTLYDRFYQYQRFGATLRFKPLKQMSWVTSASFSMFPEEDFSVSSAGLGVDALRLSSSFEFKFGGFGTKVRYLLRSSTAEEPTYYHTGIMELTMKL